MFQYKLLVSVFILAVLFSDGIRCQSGEDREIIVSHPRQTRIPMPVWSHRGYHHGSSCEAETQIVIAEVKSDIEDLKQLLVGLRQKLDPDFKLPPSPESKCPPGFEYLSLARSCYKVVYEEHNWTSADQKCHDLHPEAHLVAITKSNENRALKSYLEQELAKNSHLNLCKLHTWGDPGKMLWTSGQRQNETSCASPFVWKLSNDTQLPLSFTDWNPHEPNCHANEEFCIHMRPMLSFKWNDLSCDKLLCPLCEYDP